MLQNIIAERVLGLPKAGPMNFDLNDEQQEIKSTAKEFFAARFKPEKVRELAEARSYDDGLNKQIAELGWPGIAIAEDDGGQGLGHGRAGRPARGVRIRLRARRRCWAPPARRW